MNSNQICECKGANYQLLKCVHLRYDGKFNYVCLNIQIARFQSAYCEDQTENTAKRIKTFFSSILNA